MNWVDLALVLIILLAVWAGWNRGFILGTLDLINWLGSVLLGFLFYPYLASGLKKIIPALGAWTMPIAFLLTIIIARILIGLITKRIAWATTPRAHESTMNKFLGLIPGFINGVILATIVSALLLALPLWDGVTKNTQNSKVATKLSDEVEWVNEKMSPVLNDAVNETINKLTIHPGSDEIVKLPF